MSSTLNDQNIRECAYYLWEADGKPNGRDVEYWENARSIIMMQASQAAGLWPEPNGYRIRLRFRITKPLNIEDEEISLRLDDWPATLRSQEKGQALKDAYWLVLELRRLPTEGVARSLGGRLKHAITFASLCCRLGVDLGDEVAASGAGIAVIDWAKGQGVDLRNTVHGLDVFPDRENTRFIRLSGSLSVITQAEPFLTQISSAVRTLPQDDLPETFSISLLNAALASQEPLAQMVLAISAVELLGQHEKWSSAQLRLLKLLAAIAKEDSSVSDVERMEVAKAIERAYKLGLAQGVRRVLDALGLSHLKANWKKVYDGRSDIVHGRRKVPAAEQASSAHEAISLCGLIILKAASRDGATVPPEIRSLWASDGS